VSLLSEWRKQWGDGAVRMHLEIRLGMGWSVPQLAKEFQVGTHELYAVMREIGMPQKKPRTR
jgi:hypothetical protein